MKWEGLDLHIENLLPGMVILMLSSVVIPQAIIKQMTTETSTALLSHPFVATGVFAAASYVVGVIAIALSRFAVDRPSEWIPRPVLLKLFSRGKVLDSLNTQGRRNINEKYRDRIKQALGSNSEEIRKEVVKRRERGRMVRTALIPVMVTAWLVGSRDSVALGVIAVAIAFLLFILIYAYVEVTIYEECLLA